MESPEDLYQFIFAQFSLYWVSEGFLDDPVSFSAPKSRFTYCKWVNSLCVRAFMRSCLESSGSFGGRTDRWFM